VSHNLWQNWALGSRPTRTINRRLAGWAAKRIIAHEARWCRRLSWVPQTSALLWTSDHRRQSAQPPSPHPACHHGYYCCTVAQMRWLVSALCTMEIVQLLKCIMYIAWTFSTSPPNHLRLIRGSTILDHTGTHFLGGDLYAGARDSSAYMMALCLSKNGCQV